MPLCSLTQSDLDQFIGSENYYRHSLVRNFSYTDGVKFLADEAQAHWLVDEIALANAFNERVRAEEFQVWILKKKPSRVGAVLCCENGNGVTVLSHFIHIQDFPLDTVKLYFENRVLCLPSER